MERCQRDVLGRVIPETWLTLPIALVVDSSGTMGEYPPSVIETAANAFFRALGASEDANGLIEVCVYESHGKVDLLSGFERPGALELSDVRYGGSWGLPAAIAQAVCDVADYSLLLERRGLACARPLVVAVSGNEVDTGSESFRALDEVVAGSLAMAGRVPHCLFVGSDDGSALRRHAPALECRQTGRGSLVSRMREIALEAIEEVRPRVVSARAKGEGSRQGRSLR